MSTSASLETEMPGLCQQMRSWRRQIHARPETAFEEVQTASLVAEELRIAGLEVHTGLAKTGVVGVLRGAEPDAGARAIGLRADLDALHLTEENTFDHRSCNAGKMHACGHDGHTAMLLGAARYLARTRRFSGTVYFIFQPAEENEGGGRLLVEEGLLDRFPMDAVFGLHNLPGVPTGEFVTFAGPMLASFDVFRITLTGKGAHAAMPHLSRDPVLVGSSLVLQLQSIVSRDLDPLDAAVVSVTTFHAGETWNVIPETAVLTGTVRAFDEKAQRRIEERMRALCAGLAQAQGVTIDVSYERRYPPTINAANQTLAAQRVIEQTFGKDKLRAQSRPIMAADDFAYLARERPGCFVLIGNGDGANRRELHNPRYDFNDDLLDIGATYWARLVEAVLGTK